MKQTKVIEHTKDIVLSFSIGQINSYNVAGTFYKNEIIL